MKIGADKAEEYYYQADPVFSLNEHLWVGQGAENLGLKGAVDFEASSLLLRGLSPDGSQRLAGRESDHGKNAATDIPLALPKSFSIVALYDDQFREGLKQAFVDTASFVEQNVYGRQTIDGKTEMVDGKMVGSLYFHSTSRAGDAHIHGHLLIMNVVERPDGTHSTLENHPLFKAQTEIRQELYSNIAAVAREHGYGVDLHLDKGMAVVPEISGVSAEVRDLFSKRHLAIDKSGDLANSIRDRLPTLSERDVNELVQLQTKSAKDKDMSHHEMIRSHDLQLQGIDTSSQAVIAAAKSAGAAQQQERLAAGEYIKMAVSDLVERESVVSRHDILSTAVRLSVGDTTRTELEKAFQEATAQRAILEVGANTFTTPEMQRMEATVARIAVEHSDSFNPLMMKDEAQAAVKQYEQEKGFETTKGQAAAIEHVLSGTGRLMLIQGDAGAGKSTAFEAVNSALSSIAGSSGDITIRGFGFQGKAAAVLEQGSGIRSQTIHSFLQSKSDWDGHSRQLWVVDEASMVGSRQMHGMLERAVVENAQLVLVGDQKQIMAISAGKLFVDLQQHGLVSTSVMDEVLRQKTDYTRDVAAALKDHNMAKAFDLLDQRGNIHQVADSADRINLAAERYIAAGDGALAVTVTNRGRVELIQQIRTMEKVEGRIGQDDHSFNVRQPVNLMGVAKRLAVSYEVGNSVFLNKNMDGMAKGSEALIIGQDTSRNSITVADKQGNEHEIMVRQDGNSLSQYRETETPFSIGEKVIWTKNDNSDYGKENGLKNGVTGTIEDIKDGVATIRTEQGNVVQQQMDEAFITNGQAITIDKSQGVTASHVVTLMPSDAPAELLSENKAYVALTRMTSGVEIVTDNKDQLLEAVSAPQEKSSTLEESRELISELKETLESQKAEASMAPESDFELQREAAREADYNDQSREEDATISL
jgi:conjugative relaxase-like TrwC/TraI family protein